MRLQKYLARAGVASRRHAEALIAEGRVSVNGHVVRQMGMVVGDDDDVFVDAKRARLTASFAYLVLHKPAGVMTTMRDPQRRRTVASLLPNDGTRVVPVGRLDYDTSGVLLMTNDGDLAHVLTHPRFGVEKTYRAVVKGRPPAHALAALLHGVTLDNGKSSPAKVRIVASSRTLSEIDITVHEGRNRQVRKMFERIGHPVLSLTRLRFGPIALADLGVGQVRAATERELRALRLVAAKAGEANVAARPTR
ncbi:MAG: rRNA pseudouridine synthase [Candidatus Eremiobacteraeota bacterium]|nr:rRNA pseudouridine synthase [Candidatus Eremiobacteraeota bacterium]